MEYKNTDIEEYKIISQEFREKYSDKCADDMEEYLESYPFPIQTELKKCRTD